MSDVLKGKGTRASGVKGKLKDMVCLVGVRKKIIMDFIGSGQKVDKIRGGEGIGKKSSEKEEHERSKCLKDHRKNRGTLEGKREKERKPMRQTLLNFQTGKVGERPTLNRFREWKSLWKTLAMGESQKKLKKEVGGGGGSCKKFQV